MDDEFERFAQIYRSIVFNIPLTQRLPLSKLCQGGDAVQHQERVAAIANAMRAMPRLYEQSTSGDAAIAYLHYWDETFHWYLTEIDNSARMRVAYGLVSGDGGHELRSINAADFLYSATSQIDLQFDPRSVSEIPYA